MTFFQIVDEQSKTVSLGPRQLVESPLTDRRQICRQIPKPVAETVKSRESAFENLQTDSVEILVFCSGREKTGVVGGERRHSDPGCEGESQRAFGDLIRAEAVHVFFTQEVYAAVLLFVRGKLQSLFVKSGNQLSSVEGFRFDLRSRDSTIGCHDVHAEMSPRDGALSDVIDVVVILVRNLEESEALNVEIGGIDAIGGSDLSANQKPGIIAELLDVIGGGYLLDEDAIKIDVHVGVRMPGDLQIVPSFLLDVLDLGEPFSSRDAEKDVQVLIILSDFDGSGRDDVIALAFGGGAVDLEARLHRQPLHAEQRIPQAAAGIDFGLGVFALALELEDMTVSRCLFLILDGDKLRITDTGDWAGWSDNKNIVSSGSL